MCGAAWFQSVGSSTTANASLTLLRRSLWTEASAARSTSVSPASSPIPTAPPSPKVKQDARSHLCVTASCRLTLNVRLPLGRLVRCVRCPIAYHATDLCMAAGCVILSNNSIICPNHFIPRRGVKNHEHVNVSWCFVCTEGGVQMQTLRNQPSLQQKMQSILLPLSSSLHFSCAVTVKIAPTASVLDDQSSC